MYLNRVVIVGRLGRDPESRFTNSGDAVTNFSVATTERWKNKDGEQQEKTEWHRVTMFGKVAEIAAQYLKKGSECLVEGKLQTRKYEKDGQDHYATEIVGHTLQLGAKAHGADGEDPSPQQRARAEPPKGRGKNVDDLEEDIPF
jgi:single-strand DNA-binding protein